LREIVARLGIDLDKKGFSDANKRVGQTVKQLEQAPAAANAALASVGRFFGVAAIGFAGLKLVELASDANETLNVLNASFEDNAQEVLDWSADFATAAGRSEFGMQEMAGTLGAVLNPLMERNSEVAAEMAKGLSEATVDLASFFNMADSDVLVKLRGGITGEAEGLKVLGIVMNEATLAAFALSQGINKSVKSMSIAEKTTLRYDFILDQASLAQGDAAKTSEGWANATKGLLTSLKDLGTRIGLTVLPFAEKVVIVSRNITRAFMEWQKGTKFLASVMIVLGAIGAKVALGLLIAWAPVIIPFLKFIAVVVIAAAILDEFFVFMARGDTVIGRFIDTIFGPGSASAAVDHLWEAWDRLNHLWSQVMPTLRLLTGSFKSDMETMTNAFNAFFGDVRAGWDIITEKINRFIGTVKEAFNTVKSFGFNLGVNAAAGQEGLAAARGGRDIRQLGRTAAPPPTAEVLQSLPGQNMSIDNSVTVQVAGNATAADAGRIAEASSEAQRRQARRTRAAVTQRAE
jgi:hypothetical protein